MNPVRRSGTRDHPTVQITHMSVDRRQGWNEFVAREPSFSLLQSWEWGDLKEESGWTPYRIAVEENDQIVAGVQMLVAPTLSKVLQVAYVPRGPVGDWLRAEIAAPLLDELRRIARQHKALFLRIEPPLPEGSACAPTLQRMGFRRAEYTNQPRATLIVDLHHPHDELLTRMHHKTRYNIRYAERKGVTVRVGGAEDLPLFHRLLRTTGRRTGLNPRSLDYYRREWETFGALGWSRLFIASYRGQPLAANMSAVFGDHAAYLHGASIREHGNLHPNQLLMWEAMRWAKSAGCRTFDLWGIPDEVGLMVSQGQELPATSSTEGLWGVYRFKRGFGGRAHLYAAAHDQVYSPARYAIVGRLVNSSALDRVAAWRDRLKR